jgi:putative membrane protein
MMRYLYSFFYPGLLIARDHCIMFINYITLMLTNLIAGLVLLAAYVYWGLEDNHLTRWIPGFDVVVAIALGVRGIGDLVLWVVMRGDRLLLVVVMGDRVFEIEEVGDRMFVNSAEWRSL